MGIEDPGGAKGGPVDDEHASTERTEPGTEGPGRRPDDALGEDDAVREVAETGTALDPDETPGPLRLPESPGATGPGAG